MSRSRLLLGGVAALVLFCLADELLFRYIKNHALGLPAATWVADQDLIYRLNPANSDTPGSFRGKAPAAKRPGCIRIVCIGGSTTYGHGLRAEETWPAALERALRQRGITAEVINAGVPGYGSRQNLVRYRRDIAALDADVVLVYEGWNRTGALVDPAGFVPYATPRPGDSWADRSRRFFARHSLLLQSFVIRARFQKQKAPVGEWLADPYQQVFVQDLTSLVQCAQSHGQKTALILYPALFYEGMTPSEEERFSALLWDAQAYRPEMLAELERKHAAIRQVAASTGSLVVDAQQAFGGLHGADRRAYFLDAEHLNAAGCKKLAAVVCDRLMPILAVKDKQTERSARGQQLELIPAHPEAKDKRETRRSNAVVATSTLAKERDASPFIPA